MTLTKIKGTNTKGINRTGLSFILILLFSLSACVTINVYFPAAQAEAAAERIVDEILGEPNQGSSTSDEDNKGAGIFQIDSSRFVADIGSFFISNAHAAQPDFSVNTPEIKRLEASMAQRHNKLKKYYDNGAIGFDKNGTVAWRDQKAVSIKEKGSLNSLLRSENNDRNSLYKAIAKANGHPEWEQQVRDVFAKKWSQKAKRGWWYQNSKGQWKQK